MVSPEFRPPNFRISAELVCHRAAKGLGVSRTALSELLNGRRGISPEMAIRLSVAFGGNAESWITQQAQYDLWKAMQSVDKIKSQVRVFA
jgi:antitoxin HigA-1